MRTAVRKTHIKAIAERYILEGETADGALMFLPSEAVYAELHANFPEIVREGFAARVWIVSPTTCMATLNTMRAILKDARMREQAGAIRRELGCCTRMSSGWATGSATSTGISARQAIKISRRQGGTAGHGSKACEFEDAPAELVALRSGPG
jgi:hypothetical protein